MSQIDFDHYCCRCDSTKGYDVEHPNFCTVCWEPRMPVPQRVLDEFERLEDEADRLAKLVKKLEGQVNRLSDASKKWKRSAERWYAAARKV